MSHFALSVQLCIVLRSNAFASCAMYHMLWLTDQWYMLTIHLWDGWIQMTMPLHNWIINCALFAVGLRIVLLSVQCQFDWSLKPLCLNYDVKMYLTNSNVNHGSKTRSNKAHFSLFHLTLHHFTCASIIWFAKAIFAPYSAKVFFWTSGKKGHFCHFAKSSQTNPLKNTYFCFVLILLCKTPLKLP